MRSKVIQFFRVYADLFKIFALAFMCFSTGMFVSSQYLWAGVQKQQADIWKGIHANERRLVEFEAANDRLKEALRQARNAEILWRWDAARHGSKAAIDWQENRELPAADPDKE